MCSSSWPCRFLSVACLLAAFAFLPFEVSVTLGSPGGPDRPTFFRMLPTPGMEDIGATGSESSINRVVKAYNPIGLERAKPPKQINAPPDKPGRYADPRLIIETAGFSGGNVSALAFSPDGKMLAAAGDVVRIWDLDDGKLRYTLRGQLEFGGVGACTDMAFTPDGKQLLVSVTGYQASLRVYDMSDPSEIKEVFASHDGHVHRLAISRDGRWLATAGADNRLCLWDWPKREPFLCFSLHHPLDHLSFPTEQPIALAVDMEGNYDAVGVSLDEVHRRDPDPAYLRSNKPIISAGKVEEMFARFANDDDRWPDKGSPYPFALELDLDEKFFVASGKSKKGEGHRYWCGVWSSDSSKPVCVYDQPYFVTACTASRDKKWIATADGLGKVHVWNAETAKRRHIFAPAIRRVYSVAFDESDTCLSFGRSAMTPKQGWTHNHYAMLTQQFSLARGVVCSITSRKPPEAILSRNKRKLRCTQTETGMRELRIERNKKTEASLPFGGASRILPLCFTYLQHEVAGFRDGVVVGTEGGGLACLEPGKLLPRRSFAGHSDRVWCVDESDDGRFLASGSGDGTIRIWSLSGMRDWGDLAAFTEGNGRVYHVVPKTPTERAGICPDDVVVAIEGRSRGSWIDELARTGHWPFRSGEKVKVDIVRNGASIRPMVELSNMGDICEPLLSVFISPDARDWIVWTPQGYYDASAQGDRYVGWHVNRGRGKAADYYPIEQFREKLYQPELIDLILELGDVEKALEQANRGRNEQIWDFRKHWQQFGPPQVRLVEPSEDTTVSEGRIFVKAQVFSQNGLPLRDVRVLVDGKAQDLKGVELEGVAQTTIQHYDDEHWEIAGWVDLTEGDNEIAVKASTENAWSRPVVARVTYKPPSPPLMDTPLPRLFVVAVGVSQYEDERFELLFAHRDAIEFAAAWESQVGALYSEVKTKVVTDGDATAENILDAMQWLVDEARPQDTVVFFLSGHGVRDESRNNNYYFATHNMQTHRMLSTALSWRQFSGLISDVRSRRLLVFADTCHAGGVAGEPKNGADPIREIRKEDGGAVLFASCHARSTSIESKTWRHGAFTKALLDSFRSADSDLEPKDGMLSITELTHNLETRVAKLTKGQQKPVIDRPRSITNFDFFQIPSSSIDE